MKAFALLLIVLTSSFWLTTGLGSPVSGATVQIEQAESRESARTRLAGGPSQSPMPPEEVARSFYRWYLHALYRSPAADPFKEQKAEFEKYVTARLFQELTTSRRTGRDYKGVDVDIEYFFKTLDLDSDWEKNIVTLMPSTTASTAQVLLQLIGHDADSEQELRVVLKKEGGLWKIDRVALWR